MGTLNIMNVFLTMVFIFSIIKVHLLVISFNIRCAELKLLGHGLGTKFFALAFPKGSRYRDAISHLILKYRDDGTLHNLKKKWNRSR